MKNGIHGARIQWLVATAAAAAGTVCHADNPIIQTKYTADPAPLVHDGTVYLYTSHDEDDAQGFKMFNWMLYTTTDMVNWTDHGIIGGVKEPHKTFAWADGHSAWAPQCIARNGKFYFYCPTIYQSKMAIGVAVADSPFGPFVDALGKPLIYRSNHGDYDPTVFIDDDGQAYLYWGGNGPCYYAKLNEDMVSISGEIQIADIDFTDTPPEASFTEGPWIWKKNGHYYLAYASRCCPEGIGYAMSDSPTGPWRCKGTIMDPSALSDGNHPGIIDYKGKSYVFGFNYEVLFSNQGERKKRERRSICVKEMTYNDDGTIPKVSWWGKGTAVPGAAQIEPFDPYVRTEAETIAWSEGMKSEPCSEGGMNVYPTRDGAFIKVAGVDFGAPGAGTFSASVACDTAPGIVKGASIELRLDGVDGPLIGTMPVSYTDGAWKTETIAIEIAESAGVRDLFFVFKGESASLCKFDWWKFEKKTDKPELVAVNVAIERYKIDTAADEANRVPLTVDAVYSDGTSKDVSNQAKITVDKPGVATVGEGEVAGTSPGEAKLVASFEGKSDVLALVVKDLKAEFTPRKLIVGTTDAQLVVGSTLAVTVSVEYFDGHVEDITELATYAVENPKVASVKNGVVAALEKGETTIRLEFKGKLGKPVSASIKVSAAYRDPFKANQAAEFDAQSGVSVEGCSLGGRNIGSIQNGAWICFKALDFGSGANAVEFRVASATGGGTIEIYLDRVDTAPVGTCEVKNTGGWQSWVVESCALRGVTGRHDVYFKFTGGPGYLLNVYDWKFKK